MRGPVGSLAAPEVPASFEMFDAGRGVTVYLEDTLLEKAAAGDLTFQFGLLGRCTAALPNQ